MKVPIVQLTLPDEIIDKVGAVLKSGMWAEGKPVRELEEDFKNYIGTKYCRAVNSGTAALLSIIGVLGLKPGDEIIIPSFSFVATANCLLPSGLKPVFADIDPDTYNISPDSIREKITEKTKGILFVDLYGLCANGPELQKIAKEKNLVLIEDSCQAHGAEIDDKKAGTFGIAGAFSLYPTKNMYAGGEGGLITTDDDDLYQKINRFVNHGQKEKYVHTDFGYNFRMMNVAAICAKYSLSVLEENNKKRIDNAKILNDILGDVPGITVPTHPKNYKHVYHQYTIRSDKRDALSEELIKNQIGFGIHYKIPIHQQPYYTNMGYKDVLPNTEKACAEVISLPVHPLLSPEQVQFVAETVKKFQTTH